MSSRSNPVVVGYDGSPAGEAALTRGIEEAARSGGRLFVVVASLPLMTTGATGGGSAFGDGLVVALPMDEPPAVERLLADARKRVEAAGLADADYVWEPDEPVAALVREARDRDAALIVVGQGHHGRFARWLGSDVAVEVERAASCPVIVVEA